MRWTLRPARRLACLALAGLVATACSTWGGFADPHPGQIRERPEIAIGKETLKLHLARPSIGDAPKVLLLHTTGDSGWHGLDPQYFDAMAGRGYTLAGVSARPLCARMREFGADATPARLAEEFLRLIAEAEQRLHLAPGTPVVLTGLSRGAGLTVVAATEPALAQRIAGIVVMGLTADEEYVRPTALPYQLLDRIDRPIVQIQSTRDRHVAAERARAMFGPDRPDRKLVAIEASGHTFGGSREELFRQVEAALARFANPPSGQAPPSAAHRFTTQGHQFVLDGKPLKILAGELHYARIPREYWRQRLRMARAMGLNTVATYVFWNVHEPEPGVFDFAGNADVAAFIRLAQEEGLHVLLRAGPYSCAEWELGGFPSWLLATPESQKALRSNDPVFTGAVERWMTRLGRELAPLQIGRGGPIIATQIENEYGLFGSDHAYMATLKAIFLKAGFTECLLYTGDNWQNMTNGVLPGVFAGTNFGVGNGEKGLAALSRLRPGEPLFVSEYWPGWFDHWGRPHETRPIEPQLADLDYMLAHGSGVNIYMFHGGTSFGFMSGASWTDGRYLPDVTSYDYDAPLDEAGHPTRKYHAYRELLSKYAATPPPAVPEPPPVVTIAPFALQQAASLWANLPEPVTSEHPQSMERLGQSYGYILYRRTLAPGEHGTLELDALHDYAWLYLDGQPAGTLDRRLGEDRLALAASSRPARLDILVENSGRINIGAIMREELKGITREVRLNGTPLAGWQIFSLPMKSVPSPDYPAGATAIAGPALLRAEFQLEAVGDVYLDVRALGKGALWINGHAIGRYWNIGPQQTLYVPGPWLRRGRNEVVVFDVFGLSGDALPKLAGLPAPILGEVRTAPR